MIRFRRSKMEGIEKGCKFKKAICIMHGYSALEM